VFIGMRRPEGIERFTADGTQSRRLPIVTSVNYLSPGRTAASSRRTAPARFIRHRHREHLDETHTESDRGNLGGRRAACSIAAAAHRTYRPLTVATGFTLTEGDRSISDARRLRRTLSSLFRQLRRGSCAELDRHNSVGTVCATGRLRWRLGPGRSDSGLQRGGTVSSATDSSCSFFDRLRFAVLLLSF
jgi:hypothetical protein